jgi:two-component system, NtrC family, sensor kinase
MAGKESTMHLRETQDGDYPYFRRLWNSVVVALLAASFIPLLVDRRGHVLPHRHRLWKEKTLANLRTEVSYHRKAIDAFLAERTMNLKLLASNLGLEYLTPPAIWRRLSTPWAKYPCFTDLGIIDDQGRHLAYVGPYDLLSKNYSEASWFKELKDREIYISDVFLGSARSPTSSLP